MDEIVSFLRDSIMRNTGVRIEKKDDNILDYDTSPLDLLYVIIDIEREYGVSARDFICNMSPDSFSIEKIAKTIYEKRW